MVVSLRHLREADTLHYQLYIELLLIYNVYSGGKGKKRSVADTFMCKADSFSALPSAKHIPLGILPPSGESFWQMLSKQLRINCLVYSTFPCSDDKGSKHLGGTTKEKQLGM